MMKIVILMTSFGICTSTSVKRNKKFYDLNNAESQKHGANISQVRIFAYNAMNEKNWHVLSDSDQNA